MANYFGSPQKNDVRRAAIPVAQPNYFNQTAPDRVAKFLVDTTIVQAQASAPAAPSPRLDFSSSSNSQYFPVVF